MAATAVKPPLPAVERFFQFSLLGMLASGYFAVASSGYLDWPTQAVLLLGLIVRLAKVAGWVTFELSKRTLLALEIGYLGFCPLDYLFLSHSLPVTFIHLLVFQVMLKMVTAKTERDYGFLRMFAAL